LFIRNLMQDVGWLPQGSGGVRKYDGWYPKLFYRPVSLVSFGGADSEASFQENFGANASDQIVTDVHTDVPDPFIMSPDPGSVLHQGIGSVPLLMMAVESGGDRMIFAGPVLSHYEFEIVGNPRRLNDDEWHGILWGYIPPDVATNRVEGVTPPAWTQSYF